ncbi:hypothetical protein OG535_18925 [Kitasatospora sp. NBC_00085]|uniref:hypothetical protein n=1 Tax=Kitasatospora sp. NBC_00085 TaxID=2903566 RepID=UPI0032522955
MDRGVHGDRPGDDRGRRRRPGRRHRLGQTLALLEQLAARSKAEQYDLAAAGRQLARNNRLRVLLAAPAPGNRRDDAVGMVRAVLLRHGDWSGWDVHLSGPPDLAPALAELPAGLGADPGRVLHDPVPVTFDRTRPLTSSDWFLDQRDVPWINRTELG